jgi:hypothetical protein
LKKRFKAASAVMLVMTALVAAVSLSSPASASQASSQATTSSPAPSKPGPRGQYSSGQMRDSSACTKTFCWCITAPKPARDHDPVFLARCVLGDAYQLWHCVKIDGIGECSLMALSEGLDLGQYGPTDNARLLNPDKNGNHNYILSFISMNDNRWLITSEGWKKWRLAMPSKLNPHYVYPTFWKKGGLKGFTFLVTLTPWKEIEPGAATAL